MQRYWGDEVATAAVLSPDGWLRTGDLGWRDASGNCWLVGRLKDVIRSGGENVSAPEVERVLIRHPRIRSAAVVALPHDRFGEQVAACVVLEEGTPWEGPCEPVPTVPEGSAASTGPQPSGPTGGAGQNMAELQKTPGAPQSHALQRSSAHMEGSSPPGDQHCWEGIISRTSSAEVRLREPPQFGGVPLDGQSGGAGRESVSAGRAPQHRREFKTWETADGRDEGGAGVVDKLPPIPGGLPGDSAGGEESGGQASCLGSQRDYKGVERLSGSVLRQFCLKEGLSPFMVPRVWVAQSGPLPLNSSGKVLKGEVVKEMLRVLQATRGQGESKL